MSIDGRMDKADAYTMEYYSAIKKHEIMPFAQTWMDLAVILLTNKTDRGTQIL